MDDYRFVSRLMMQSRMYQNLNVIKENLLYTKQIFNSTLKKTGARSYLQFLSAFNMLMLIKAGFTGSGFPDAHPALHSAFSCVSLGGSRLGVASVKQCHVLVELGELQRLGAVG